MIPAIYASPSGESVIFHPVRHCETVDRPVENIPRLPAPSVRISLESSALLPYSASAQSLPVAEISCDVPDVDAGKITAWISEDSHALFGTLSDSFSNRISSRLSETLSQYQKAADDNGLFTGTFLCCAMLVFGDGNRYPLIHPFRLSVSQKSQSLYINHLSYAESRLYASVEWSAAPCRLKVEITDPGTLMQWENRIAGMEILVSPQTDPFMPPVETTGTHTALSDDGTRRRAWLIPSSRPVPPQLPAQWRRVMFVSFNDMVSCGTLRSSAPLIPSETVKPEFTVSERADVLGETFRFNSRLFIPAPLFRPAALRYLPDRYSSGCADNGKPGTIYVRFIKDGVSCHTAAEINIPAELPLFLCYPSPDALEIILEYKDGSGHRVFPLTRSESGGTAVWCDSSGMGDELPQLREGGYEPPLSSRDITDGLRRPGSIFSSLRNNDMLYPASLVTEAIDGEVLALAPALRSPSSDRLGEFPLYCFTSEGIWIMRMEEDAPIRATQPISMLSPLNSRCVATINKGTVFLCSEGLMIISGSNISVMKRSDTLRKIIKRLRNPRGPRSFRDKSQSFCPIENPH